MKNRNEINRISCDRAGAGRAKTRAVPERRPRLAFIYLRAADAAEMLDVHGKRSFAINSDKTFRRHFRLFVCFIYGEDNRGKSLQDLCAGPRPPRSSADGLQAERRRCALVIHHLFTFWFASPFAPASPGTCLVRRQLRIRRRKNT